MNSDRHQIYNHWVDELATISDEEFFPLLKQFLDLLIKENPTKIEILQKQIDADNNRRAQYIDKAVKGLERLLEEVETEAKREKIGPLPEIDNYKLVKKGEIRTSESLPDTLYHAIRLTIESNWSEGKFRKLENLMRVNENLWYLDFDKVCKSYPSYKLFKDMEYASNQEYKDKPWGAFRYLLWAISFFADVTPKEASDFVRPDIIGKLKRLILYLLTPEDNLYLDELELTDNSSRRAYEKKWDVLQAIWDVYESHSRPESILVPVVRLTIKGRDVQLIDGIIEGLRKDSLFQKWDRKDRWYNLEFINHERLPRAYQETGNTYKKFATTYQERSERDETVDTQAAQNIPRCVIEKGIGYLKFGKYGSKKKIGNAKNSRPFQFLQATIDPIGVFKSVDAVFTIIWREKDSQDPMLTNPSTAKARRVEIIKNSAIKELQKGSKLGGKIKFEFNQSETQVRAFLVE